jgi:hypothetical protein
MRLVERLEAEYLPLLRSLEAELRVRHPDLRFAIRSLPIGSLTSYQGHGIYIECSFIGRGHDEPDNVALMIGVCHLDFLPRIMADVCWGHPRAVVEDSLDENWTSSEHWPEVDDQTLERLTSTFPRLAHTFAQAVQRGAPPP